MEYVEKYLISKEQSKIDKLYEDVIKFIKENSKSRK
jgi:hypothetical protein